MYFAGRSSGLAPLAALAQTEEIQDRWALAAEEYADFGPLRQFYRASDQSHQVWAVVNHHIKLVVIETGVGVRVTSGADKLTFKLMLSCDLK